MNDLDKRIAELKGWAPSKERREALVANGSPINVFMPLDGWVWSTSDSKALELVDEWLAAAPGLIFVVKSWGPGWCAEFINSQASAFLSAEAPTRPEAICRAYVAAREWMATKAAEDAWRKGEEAKTEALHADLRDQDKRYLEGLGGMATKAGA